MSVQLCHKVSSVFSGVCHFLINLDDVILFDCSLLVLRLVGQVDLLTAPTGETLLTQLTVCVYVCLKPGRSLCGGFRSGLHTVSLHDQQVTHHAMRSNTPSTTTTEQV